MISYSPQLWSDLESLTRHYGRLGKNLKLRTGIDKVRFEQEREVLRTRMYALSMLEYMHRFTDIMTEEIYKPVQLLNFFLDRRNGSD